MAKSYAEVAAARLEHVKSHVEGGYRLPQLLHYIDNGLGDPHACVNRLAGYASARAMLAWFGDHDLHAMKNWCYNVARLEQKGYAMRPDTTGPRSKVLQLLEPLLSDNDAIIS